MTSSVIGLRRSSKVLPKAKLTLKKGHGHCLLVWSTTTAWILVKPWHLRSVLSKSKRYTESCSACSWHRSAERARFFSVTMPNCMSHSLCFKLNELGYQVLPHLPYSPGLLPTNYHFLKHLSLQLFTGKMLSQQVRSKKCFPWVCQIPKHGFLCYKDKPTYSLLAKMFWL